MKYITKVTLVVLYLAILQICFLKKAIAADVFYDDFSSGSLDKWLVEENDTSWSVQDGKLRGEITRGQSEYIYAMNFPNIGDYELSAKVLNITGVDQHFLFRVSPDYSSFYQLELRYGDVWWNQSDVNSVRLWAYKNGNYRRVISPDVPYSLVQNNEYRVRVVLKGSNIKVFVDDDMVIDIDDVASGIDSGGIGLQNYAGDYFQSSVVNVFDDVRVTDDSEATNKIFILPGFGASWNTQAIVYNQTLPDLEWKMTPFVSNYNKLKETLTANNLIEGDDFFVWNYDWRQPVDDIVADFNEFVEENTTEGDKVDLIGHSLGGLVARVWAQNNKTKTGEVISLGSPHFGAVGAYEAWYGAKVGTRFGVGGAALNILLKLQGKGKSNDLEVIRAYAPALRDILPTFDFVKKNGTLVSTGGNPYLTGVNMATASIFDIFSPVVGVGKSTIEWINVGDASVMEKAVNLWPQGKPISYVWGGGDGTILKKSAKFDSHSFASLASDHGEIVDKSVPWLMSRLGLGVSGDNNSSVKLNKTMVFFIGSPAFLKVSCDDEPEQTSDELGFVVIDNVDDKCVVQVIGTSQGEYHLVTGRIGEDESFKYWNRLTDLGKVDTLVIRNDGSLGLGSELFLKELLISQLRELESGYRNNIYLTKAITDATNSKWAMVLDGLFKFRKQTKAYGKSQPVLTNLTAVLNLSAVSPSVATKVYKTALKAKSVVDNTTRLKSYYRKIPSKDGATNYLLMEKLFLTAKQSYDTKNFSEAYGNSLVLTGLSKEVW